jgi:hypothetical protein
MQFPHFALTTCENCLYQMNGECRRNPPLIVDGPKDTVIVMYPPVEYEGGWNEACGEYTVNEVTFDA